MISWSFGGSSSIGCKDIELDGDASKGWIFVGIFWKEIGFEKIKKERFVGSKEKIKVFVEWRDLGNFVVNMRREVEIEVEDIVEEHRTYAEVSNEERI